MKEVLCWTDAWVYEECCDVKYGPYGFGLSRVVVAQRYGPPNLDCFLIGFLYYKELQLIQPFVGELWSQRGAKSTVKSKWKLSRAAPYLDDSSRMEK